MKMEGGKKRVLIVDDSSIVQLYYREALERAGFQVDGALNGIEALEKLLTEPVDLLVVDINMPKMDGLSFLRALRAKDLPLSSIPALVTSTESTQKDIDAAVDAGANYYLVKPIASETFTVYAKMLSGAAT
jgi:two-component system chemotaxis response regulator CheY